MFYYLLKIEFESLKILITEYYSSPSKKPEMILPSSRKLAKKFQRKKNNFLK